MNELDKKMLMKSISITPGEKKIIVLLDRLVEAFEDIAEYLEEKTK